MEANYGYLETKQATQHGMSLTTSTPVFVYISTESNGVVVRGWMKSDVEKFSLFDQPDGNNDAKHGIIIKILHKTGGNPRPHEVYIPTVRVIIPNLPNVRRSICYYEIL